MGTTDNTKDTETLLSHPELVKKTVTVNYSNSKVEILKKTEHVWNTSIRTMLSRDEILDGMKKAINQAPKNGEGVQEKEIYFIPLRIIPETYCTEKVYINNHALDVFFKLHGLISADLYTAATIAKQDPYFSDRYQYVIHFRNGDDGWYSAIFYRSMSGYGLNISSRETNLENKNWYFAVELR